MHTVKRARGSGGGKKKQYDPTFGEILTPVVSVSRIILGMEP